MIESCCSRLVSRICHSFLYEFIHNYLLSTSYIQSSVFIRRYTVNILLKEKICRISFPSIGLLSPASQNIKECHGCEFGTELWGSQRGKSPWEAWSIWTWRKLSWVNFSLVLDVCTRHWPGDSVSTHLCSLCTRHQSLPQSSPEGLDSEDMACPNSYPCGTHRVPHFSPGKHTFSSSPSIFSVDMWLDF